MAKFLKMLIGVLLLPSCWAVSVSTYNLYQESGDVMLAEGGWAWALPVGFAIWVIIYFLLPRPTRAYVLGHELTHAMWALMMGARVGKIAIGSAGGHVELTKTNFLIALAPYFFPFYTFLVIGTYYLAGIWVDVEAYKVWWLALVGFTWAFHVTFTMHMLAQYQPDIKAHGRIFSYTFIYLMNVLGMGVWIVIVGNPAFQLYGELLSHELVLAYRVSWEHIVTGYLFVAELFKGPE